MWTDELFDEIQKGDRVWYENEQGQTCKGKAMMIGPMGWVLQLPNGQAKVVNEGYNYLGHKPAKDRQPDHLGHFLNKHIGD
jgi:ADP-ribosylglycohydrolase